MVRTLMADLIFKKLVENKDSLVKQWEHAVHAKVHFFYLDDLLPQEMVYKIYEAFPPSGQMMVRKSLREFKTVAAQMDKYNPILEEIIYAFQDSRIVGLIEQITGLKSLEPDTLLYAGGVSKMDHGHFLNPHLDNSHDKFRDRYRVLNLLFYVSPDWKIENGGNLELWPQGPKENQITIESKFNRLVVMATDQYSWHSVSKVKTAKTRCCISNYYFSKHPVGEHEYFHITTFRGRPEEKIRNILLTLDGIFRMAIRKIFPHGMKKTKHFYKK